ncbi:MAG: HAMP domain-containing histidine kinase, partial [Campylobacteraceae bacterium]|nr:HAMP domain-containing histidine kinase [Campylobacteraceae bacterium]
QKDLEEQQQMLTQQSKSAAMGEMISMIAHQWRQPLQTISILVQKLPLTRMLGDDISDELLEQVLEDVNIQIDYMSNTIEDFRDFFKPNKEKNEIDLNELVLKAVDFLSYMLNLDSIKVNIDKSEDRKISVHVNEIIQVLINIIKNARDVMIESELEDREINIRTYVTDSNVVIEIEDNAGGIPSAIIEKVFDPYFSTKHNKNGTGLGLYMSKTIIEQHSLGKLTVSNSQLGAVFKIELPL